MSDDDKSEKRAIKLGGGSRDRVGGEQEMVQSIKGVVRKRPLMS